MDRTERLLTGLEQKANADIAAAREGPAPSRANLDVAMANEARVASKLDELWKRRRALEALPEPKPPSLVSRLFARAGASDSQATGTVAEATAEVRAQLMNAEREWLRAKGGVAQAERVHREATAVQQGQAEQVIRAANAVLNQVKTARRLTAGYPRIIYCGPDFVHWAARRTERHRRRYALIPTARNIWGLPLED